MEPGSYVQMGIACTKACFAKSCGNEKDSNQTVIYDAAGDAKSESGSKDEEGDN